MRPHAAGPGLLGLAVIIAGCSAGTKFHGYFDAANWSPDFDCWTAAGGSPRLDTVATTGVVDDDTLWAYDLNLQFQAPRRGSVGAYAMNLGFLKHTYRGAADLAADVDYAGQTLSGRTNTVVDLDLYKFTYEEPGRSAGGSERTGGLLGLHYLSFTVESADEYGTLARYHENAPMLVFGWRIAYFSQDLLYFFSAEGMDLNLVPIENVKGSVLDTSAGLRWFVTKGTSMNAAISIAYREYEADLEIRGDTFHVRKKGPFFSLYLQW